MEYFYSASVMGYGLGRNWHKNFNFPKFKRVTKTLTLEPRIGIPFAILKTKYSVWNKVGLHNIGIIRWIEDYWMNMDDDERKNTVVSIAGTDYEIDIMISLLNMLPLLGGIELNFSCPNVKDNKNSCIPSTKFPLYLKLNYTQDPHNYDINNIDSIRLNSIPYFFGGLSGRGAQAENWKVIKRWCNWGLNVAGASCVTKKDLYKMVDFGCKEVGIGSLILINPTLVETLR